MDGIGPKGLTIKKISETRWECRIDSVKAVWYQLSSIADVLDQISDIQGDPMAQSKATSLHDILLTYEFILSTIVWHDILFKINVINKAWQNMETDMNVAVKHITAFPAWLDEYRENDFEAAESTAKEIVTTWIWLVSLPRSEHERSAHSFNMKAKIRFFRILNICLKQNTFSASSILLGNLFRCVFSSCKPLSASLKFSMISLRFPVVTSWTNP